MNQILYRATDSTIIDVDEKNRIVRGVFASFGNKNSHGEIFQKGAFRKSILEHGPGSSSNRKIKHLANHWMDDVIGKIVRLEETSMGLEFETMTGRHQLGIDSLMMYLDGIITEHSIGFEFVNYEENTEKEEIIVKEVKLWEGSYVTFGSDMNTPNLTGRDNYGLLAYMEKLNKALRCANYSDETFLKIEKEAKEIAHFLESRKAAPIEAITQQEPIDYEKALSFIKL